MKILMHILLLSSIEDSKINKLASSVFFVVVLVYANGPFLSGPVFKNLSEQTSDYMSFSYLNSYHLASPGLCNFSPSYVLKQNASFNILLN